MKDNRKIKKTSSIWRSRSFCVIATTLILWVWGDIAQPQATSCQVGTYDCAGQLYLNNGRVGIGTANPDTTLHVAGTGAKLRIGSQDTVNEGGEIQLDGAGSNTEWIMDNYQSRFRLHHGGTEYISINPTGNMGIGTTATAEKLQVAGSAAISGRVNAGGGYGQPGAGGETLRILRGEISRGGTLNLGSGFSVSRSSPGRYNITFSTAFSSRPACVGSLGDFNFGGSSGFIEMFGSQTGNVQISTYNPSSQLADRSFNFICVGPS